jgi:hypothetical protein
MDRGIVRNPHELDLIEGKPEDPENDRVNLFERPLGTARNEIVEQRKISKDTLNHFSRQTLVPIGQLGERAGPEETIKADSFLSTLSQYFYGLYP